MCLKSVWPEGTLDAFIKLVLMWTKEHETCYSKTGAFLNGILEGHGSVSETAQYCLTFNVFRSESHGADTLFSQSWILFKMCVLSIYWEFRDGLNFAEDICLRKRTGSSLQESKPRRADLGKLHLMFAIHSKSVPGDWKKKKKKTEPEHRALTGTS